MSDDVTIDEQTIDVLRRFTEGHVREYGNYAPLLAVIRARERLGIEPAVPEFADGMWEELEKSPIQTDEETHEELRRYMEVSDE